MCTEQAAQLMRRLRAAKQRAEQLQAELALSPGVAARYALHNRAVALGEELAELTQERIALGRNPRRFNVRGRGRPCKHGRP
jgi:hypothetical protein